MTDKKYIVALDQGTTSSRAVVMDHDANIVSVSQREFEQIYPKPGWVEHDPMEIWASQSSTLVEALAKADINSDQIAAIGITNQRETVVVWERETGKPIYNAIVWQCRRTAEICEQLKRDGMEEYIRKATGLSQAKLAALLDVQVTTLQNWEQGRRAPSGPAKALLKALKNDPVHVLKAMA